MVMRGKKHWLSWVFEIGIVTEVPHYSKAIIIRKYIYIVDLITFYILG